MSGLYPHVFSIEPDGRRAVMACAADELHELGARMVADFLQLDGWDVSFLSASVPISSIVTEAEQTPARPLRPVSEVARTTFQDHRAALVDRTVEASLAFPEQLVDHGDDAREMLTMGLTFTTRSLETAITFGTVDLLADQLQWAMDRLPHDGFAPDHVLHRLQLLREALHETVTAVHAEKISPYIDWMVAEQQRLIDEREVPRRPGGPRAVGARATR